MKKRTRHIVFWSLLGIVLFGIILAWQLSVKRERHFDHTVTLSYKDKRPYGAYVAYQEMSQVFPKAEVTVSKRSDSFLQDLSDSDEHQVMFILSPHFYANLEEWGTLTRWVKQGNYLVISASRFTQDVKDQLHVQLSNLTEDALLGNISDLHPDDSLRIGLVHPPFPDTGTYFYPGRRLDRSIVALDSIYTEVLGTNDFRYANLIRIHAGKGAVLVQTAPLAFSNYFLLYGNNIHYFEQVWSTLPVSINKVIWNEYYLYKQEDQPRSFLGALSRLLADPALGPAFLVLLLLLLVYVLIEVKRKQRIIPVIAPKSNDSLDFVKTIGRLYFDKGDQRNLGIKMGQHFLEHIRSRYLVQLVPGDETSMARLSSRSGVDLQIVRDIGTTLRYVNDAPSITEAQLEEWYRLLDNFYKTAQ